MASVWHSAFRMRGFSERWLRSMDINSTPRKRELWEGYEQRREVAPELCVVCGLKYLPHAYTGKNDHRIGANHCSSTCWSESPEYWRWREEMHARAVQRQRDYEAYIADSERFHASDEWRRIRAFVLTRDGSRCALCGRSPFRHGIVVHVDHIKPRRKYPELALNPENLRVLCEQCNMGKGGSDW